MSKFHFTLRRRSNISQCAWAHYFTFCRKAKYFTKYRNKQLHSFRYLYSKRKALVRVLFLFGTMCSLRERDAHCVRDASFGRDVRLRRVSRNTSHHGERSEQHHCAEHNITCPRGQASLYKADVFCYTWYERRCEYV